MADAPQPTDAEKQSRKEEMAAKLAAALSVSETKADKPTNDSDDEPIVEVKPQQRTKEEDDELHKINTKDEDIELFSLRIFSFTEVELEKFENCTSLAMRKNLIHYLVNEEFPAHLRQQLQVFDLFDNKILEIGNFFGSTPAPWSVLRKLDLSYNQIRRIEGLEALGPTLEELFLVENRIKVIQGLETLTNLKLLELGGNRIREIGNGLDNLVNLEQLWLGKNKIGQLKDHLNKLKSLKRLSLQANRMIKISPENFPADCHPVLEELYLSENGLQAIENVATMPALKIIDYSMNPIPAIDESEVNATTMPHLEEFWLSDGKIDDYKEVTKLQCFSASLRTVYLERNPIEQDKRYRDKVYKELQFLDQIDSWPVVNRDNLEADRSIHRR